MSIISDCECRRQSGINCTNDRTCKVVPSCSLSYVRPKMLCAKRSGAGAQGVSFVRFLCISSSPVCGPHVLVHFVKSECLYSVNHFSTFFSENNQHNCPILFLFVPDLLTSRTSISFFLSKATTSSFLGKVTPSAIYFLNE